MNLDECRQDQYAFDHPRARYDHPHSWHTLGSLQPHLVSTAMHHSIIHLMYLSHSFWLLLAFFPLSFFHLTVDVLVIIAPFEFVC